MRPGSWYESWYEVLCGSWYGVLERSLVTKSWCEAFEGGGEQESFAEFCSESYAGPGKVLCGVLCGLLRRQKLVAPFQSIPWMGSWWSSVLAHMRVLCGALVPPRPKLETRVLVPPRQCTKTFARLVTCYQDLYLRNVLVRVLCAWWVSQMKSYESLERIFLDIIFFQYHTVVFLI